MRNDQTENDRPVTGIGNMPRATARTLCEDGFAYRIVAGGAELFVEESGRAGTARLLLSLQPEEAAFGVATTGTRLVLLPGAGASIETIALTDLGGRHETFSRWTDGWVNRVADAVRRMPTPATGNDRHASRADLPPSHRLVVGTNALPAGSIASPAGGAPVWCRCETGEIANAWGRATGTTDTPLPALRATPLEVLADSDIRVSSSLDLARDGALPAALSGFNAALGRRIEAWRHGEQAGFGRHIAAVADADAAALAAAMAKLGDKSRGGAGSVTAVMGEAPLAATLRVIARALGTRVPASATRSADDATAHDTLTRRANAMGLRLREVRLGGSWFAQAGEAMVARLHDGTPVALLPQRRGWHLIRPGSAEGVRVDAAVAATLADHAHVVYRGFADTPDRPGRTLAAFVFGAVRREMALIAIASLLAGLLGLATPFLSGMLVQSVIPDGVRSEILQLILAMVAVSFGVIGFELVRGLAVLRVESVLGSSVEGALWNRLLRLPPGFFRQYGAGDLALRADAVNQIRRIVGVATITALLGVVFSFVNLVVLLGYGLKPALLALAVCAVQLVILIGMALFEMSLQRRALANGGTMQTLTVQIFQGISKLRVAAAESRFLARWTRLFAVDQSLHFRANIVGSGVSAFGAGWNILVMAALIGLVGFGGVKMSLGDYVTYSGVSGQFVAAILSLAGLIPALATVIPLWERVRPILTEATEEAEGHIDPGALRGDIETSHVDFTYPGGQPALRDVSVRIPAGAFVALVGPSGSGKSSLLRLLLGFDEPDRGTVLLDGHDLRDLDTGAVRRQLGVVLQHSRIEAGSIYQNIAGAAPLSLEAAAQAASLAGLGPDIAAMPMGIHTYVDEAGATLSGGQRQRLLLARAIARRPRIMLLDEATSALDNATQAHVMETLARMNVTRVVVAHRLSTVRDADLIYVMSEGRVVEHGTYETLAAAGGLFAELIRRQTT